MKLEFSRQIFEKSSNIKLHKNLFSGSRVVPCERTDIHDEANSRLSQFSESAYKTSGGVAFHALYLWSIISIKQ